MHAHPVTTLDSPFPFAATVGKLLAAFAEKGVAVFAVIDQQQAARAAGLALPPTTLIIFGKPELGTRVMLANPEAGVDLPLKALVCENEPGHVTVSFTPAAEIIARHSLPEALAAELAPGERLIAAVLGQGDARA